MSGFASWLGGQGGYLNPKLKAFTEVDDNGDRGIVAEEDIEEGQQLMLIPLSCCLHMPTQQEQAASQGQHTAALQYLSTEQTRLSPFLSTVLLLLYEVGQGTASRFHAYLQTLPQEHDCVLCWSKGQLSELEGTAIEIAGDSTRTVFGREVLPIMQQQQQLWPPDVQTYEAFELYAGLVQSRAFHMLSENWLTGLAQEGVELYMLPAIDMINHATEPGKRNTLLRKSSAEMTVKVDGAPLTLHGFFTMKAERDISKGEQLLHTYGDLSDAQLLQTYGFVEAFQPGYENPHNFVPVPVHLVLQSCSESGDETALACFESKKRLLEQAKLLRNAFVVTAQDPLPDDLVTAVQVMHMEPHEFSELEKVEATDDMGEASTSQPASAEPQPAFLLGTGFMNDTSDAQAVCTTLLRLVDKLLRRYPTTLKDDAAALHRDRPMPHRWKMAVKVRMGEKELLQAMKQAVVMLMLDSQSPDDGDSSDEDDASPSDEEEEDSAGSDEDQEHGTGAEAAVARLLGAKASSDTALQDKPLHKKHRHK
ncbi:hypothetical protein ABBQ38_003551 [Trebouxia sp. C0009 RCD-2024]